MSAQVYQGQHASTLFYTGRIVTSATLEVIFCEARMNNKKKIDMFNLPPQL